MPAFYRAALFVQAIQAILSADIPDSEKRMRLNLMPTYRSRGHGRGKLSIDHRAGANTSKYKPHQGIKECARRQMQFAKAVRADYYRHYPDIPKAFQGAQNV